MGQPGTLNRVPPPDEHIVRRSHTRGSETSQYPEEKKSNEIARVAASESAEAQTGKLASRGCGTGDTAPDRLGEAAGKRRHSG